jgi:hypothetical protein
VKPISDEAAAVVGFYVCDPVDQAIKCHFDIVGQEETHRDVLGYGCQSDPQVRS